MTIYLMGEIAKSKEGAVEVARNIIYTSVENLASANQPKTLYVKKS